VLVDLLEALRGQVSGERALETGRRVPVTLGRFLAGTTRIALARPASESATEGD
jgi:hypothetical protein